ncbi:MAG: hypothetical protein KF729_22530 [Sandaracinaceae bacterium]|nr:hypothetical protein [Sandaracinaceae bacterium]
MGAFVGVAARGSAQEGPSAALLATSVGGGVAADVGESFDRVLAAELQALGRVRLQGSAALRFADVQLALGCEGETPACLGAVARELGVRRLLLSNLDRVGAELVLSVALYDADADAAPRRVARRAAGPDGAGALLGEVRGLLVELLGEGQDQPAAPAEAEPAEPAPVPTLPPPRGPDDGRLAGAGAVAFAGLAVLGLGAAFGVSALERTATYERAPADTVADAEEAARRFVQAREDAITANVLFVVGGVVAAAGLAWLIGELVDTGGGDVALAPVVGPTFAGVAASGAWR